MTARGLILGELDGIEFVIAETVGAPLHEVRSWPNAEIEEWRGLFMVRAQQAELEQLKRDARG